MRVYMGYICCVQPTEILQGDFMRLICDIVALVNVRSVWNRVSRAEQETKCAGMNMKSLQFELCVCIVMNPFQSRNVLYLIFCLLNVHYKWVCVCVCSSRSHFLCRCCLLKLSNVSRLFVHYSETHFSRSMAIHTEKRSINRHKLFVSAPIFIDCLFVGEIKSFHCENLKSNFEATLSQSNKIQSTFFVCARMFRIPLRLLNSSETYKKNPSR